MKELVFYRCNHCGNIAVKLVDKGVKLFCCGTMMEEIKANSVDAAKEKHLPLINIDNNVVKVSVGSISHPMTSEHYIEFLILETNMGFKMLNLTPDSLPSGKFILSPNEECLRVYSYCNLHGLWVTEQKK